MKILLACSARMSTSLLEKAVNDYLKVFEIKGQAVAMDCDVARQQIHDFDIVFLGPQIRFMRKQFETMAQGKPVAVISSPDYALANGEGVVKMAQSLLKF